MGSFNFAIEGPKGLIIEKFSSEKFISGFKKGISKILFLMTESQAIREECNLIWSIPRKSALGAYTRFGFETVGDFFDEGMEFGPNIYVKKDINVNY